MVEFTRDVDDQKAIIAIERKSENKQKFYTFRSCLHTEKVNCFPIEEKKN